MKIYNTLTRKKEELITLLTGEVTIYSCGPTVYNYFHIGNGRMFVVFDTLRRFLEYLGYKVTYVMNFTDIDDKIINRANEEGVDFRVITERFISEFYRDAKGLGIKKATFHPRATENIDAIITLISTLVDKGFAYNVDGDVYYSTKKFKEYGKLSHQPLEDLEEGARIDINEKKNDAVDFALWKRAKPEEPSWDSPWGKGRPGWHIECSAMANKILGKTIDIHTGGADLIFPHHENEIAQSEAANDAPLAKYWMHNGFININNQKMSKSLNNFFLVRDVAKEFDYEVIRFFLLSAHYRSPINYSVDLMVQSQAALSRIYTAMDNLKFLKGKSNVISLTEQELSLKAAFDKFKTLFIEAMEDDLNTADAISFIFEIVSAANVSITSLSNSSSEIIDYAISMLKELGAVLGLLQRSDEVSLEAEIEELIERRNAARGAKDFALADKIRDDLKARGITLEDTKQGVKWSLIEKCRDLFLC